jgi:hypothetical protein
MGMNNRIAPIILLVCLSLVGCSNTGYVPVVASTQTPDPAQVFVNANSSQATALSSKIISTSLSHLEKLGLIQAQPTAKIDQIMRCNRR